MLFFVQGVDKPGAAAVRQANRGAHLDYHKPHLDKIVLAGPTLTEDGQGMTGSVFVIDQPDRAAVEALFAGDPYVSAGLFEYLVIRPFKKVLP